MAWQQMTIALVAVLGLSASAVAQGTESGEARHFNPNVIEPDFGFGQFNSGIGITADAKSYMLFGGRGGNYLGDSDRWYLGGGGRGGFSLDGKGGGRGYGFMQVGNRGPVNASGELGLDAYTGLAFGGYGSETDGGSILGPVAGTVLYRGASTSFEFGLQAEVVANLLAAKESMLTLGIIIGGKSGSAVIPWERRDEMYR